MTQHFSEPVRPGPSVQHPGDAPVQDGESTAVGLSRADAARPEEQVSGPLVRPLPGPAVDVIAILAGMQDQLDELAALVAGQQTAIVSLRAALRAATGAPRG